MLAAWRERDKDKAPVSNQQGLQQKDDGNSHASARLPTWDEGEGEGGGASGVRHTRGGAPTVTAAGVLPFFSVRSYRCSVAAPLPYPTNLQGSARTQSRRPSGRSRQTLVSTRVEGEKLGPRCLPGSPKAFRKYRTTRAAKSLWSSRSGSFAPLLGRGRAKLLSMSR